MPSNRGGTVTKRIVRWVLEDLGRLTIPCDVDVGNLEVDVRDYIHTGNLGNLGDQLSGFPSIIGKRCPPISCVSIFLEAYCQEYAYSWFMPRTICLMNVELYWHSSRTF